MDKSPASMGLASRISTMSTMSDNEKDLDDFPARKQRKTGRIIGWSISRQISIASSWITTEITTLFDGSTSWFKYEELIDDWLDLTVLQAVKRGPALKNPTCRKRRNAQGTS